MGTTHVNVTVSPLTGGKRSFDASFLVDTGAIDCLAPASALKKIGIKPVRTRTYELADGRSARYQLGFARISFLGHETVVQIAFGPEKCEPLLGVVALENVAMVVDPATNTLRQLRASMLKPVPALA